MTKKEKTNYNELTQEEQLILAVKEYYKFWSAVKDVKVLTNSADITRVKVICNDMEDLLLDISLWNSKNKNESFKKYYIVRVYRLTCDKIQVEHSLYTFERIDGNNGYLVLTHNTYNEDKEVNPFKLQKLEYEYIFREHEVQGV